MFNKADSTASGTLVIFIVLLGCLFLCQTLGKLIMWLIGKFKYTAFTGEDIIEELKDKNELGNAKTKVLSVNPLSAFYSYSKKKNQFIIGKHQTKASNIATDTYALQSLAYANEKNRRAGFARWQIISNAVLSIIPYLFLLAALLMLFLPPLAPLSENDKEGTKQTIASGYRIGIEVICIIGWIFVLITLFWWMSIVQSMSDTIEDLTRQTNDMGLVNEMNWYLKICSYIPFSIRTII